MNANTIAEFVNAIRQARIVSDNDTGGFVVECYRLNRLEGYVYADSYSETSKQANAWVRY